MNKLIQSALLLSALFISWTSVEVLANDSEHILVINPIIVPAGKEAQALAIWDSYAEYFRKQSGYIGTKLHKSLDPDAKFHYINVAEWENAEDFMSALNSDELNNLGEGFPEDMPHYPSMYQVIRN